MRFSDLTAAHEVCTACACPVYRCSYGFHLEPFPDLPLGEIAARMRCRRCGEKIRQMDVYAVEPSSQQSAVVWTWSR